MGGEWTAAGEKLFTALNPATCESLLPSFHEATDAEVDRALQLADQAVDALQTLPRETMASFLEEIAIGLETAREVLIARAHAETALPVQRLEAECARTVGHCRSFAQMVRASSWSQPRIDHGNPHRQPVAKPELRTLLVGVGPVVVFGASNFPLAISVAGTDTISAFAARCPVVVKAHPAHPGTCELVAQIIAQSAAKWHLPAGVFSLLQGADNSLGTALVVHPQTSAVAFTGSLRGGRALFDLAVSRPRPIPFYGEMGSANPVFVLPGAAKQQAEAIARGYVQSINMGVGQYCTNPGLLFVTSGADGDRFIAATTECVSQVLPATMLHSVIHSSYVTGLNRIAQTPGIKVVAQSPADGIVDSLQAACTLFTASVDVLDEHPELTEEVFGPESIVFCCQSVDQMIGIARKMDCHLTATIHGTEQDLLEHAELVRILQRKVGRLVFNGFPTGLEPCHALHHGGPYPAATHSYFTSVGQQAIYRFTRPICFQGVPDAALPDEIQERNPLGIDRLVDGKLIPGR